jgi:hypothetical protein
MVMPKNLTVELEFLCSPLAALPGGAAALTGGGKAEPVPVASWRRGDGQVIP